MWHVYILQCRDGSYYTGISTDVQSRLERHNCGRGAQYTKSRRPTELVYVEKHESKKSAQQREIAIKNLSVVNKEKLIRLGLAKVSVDYKLS